MVYQGPQSQQQVKNVTINTLLSKYRKGELLTCVTAYDYPSAVHVERAGLDMVLVGDSAAMVVHGHDTTQPIDLDTMLVHCRAVCRGARRPFVIGDLPFGSYEVSVEQAVASALRLVKEGGVDAVKLEGGSPSRVAAARAIVEAGVAVMGHVGLTPQAISVIGGFRPQGRTASSALSTARAAAALQGAGCFGLILECVPAPVAQAITRQLAVPTIGIGAGPHTSGQVLVYHDLLGMMSHPHHALVTPKFVKQYASLGKQADAALEEFKTDV